MGAAAAGRQGYVAAVAKVVVVTEFAFVPVRALADTGRGFDGVDDALGFGEQAVGFGFVEVDAL